ncbi:MAG: hypothetical protein WC770_05510 [Phycisphaerae bacterium]|jgi:hypothetical protein
MPALADSNDINNPSFEIFDYNESLDYNTPTGWERVNYAAITNYFNNRSTNWDPNFRGLLPYEGNYFVVLSSLDGMTNFSEIRQEITINPGDRLTGAYFFGTHDYIPYDDWAVIQLVDTNDTVVGKNIVDVNIARVQSWGSMRGWKRFDYVFDANQAGTYDLKIAVFDKYDSILASYFAVDGLVICPNSPISGDINADCAVDFFDFAMLADDWMCDCNDNGVFNDPNHNCVYGTDSDNSGFVDFNDLQAIANHWLFGTMQGIIE